MLACVERVLESPYFVLTPELTVFDEKVAAYTGAKHCISLNSDHHTLMIDLITMGITKGDEAITSTISFVASSLSIGHIGRTPVYANVHDDQNINPEEIEKKITPRTKTSMAVHWTGRFSDMHAIRDIPDQNGLQVIEDSCQSMGRPIMASVEEPLAFSAHPLMALNPAGNASFMVTNDNAIAKRAGCTATMVSPAGAPMSNMA
jgi:UDP-2-acetamido-2-deoxy-ribo-hexuluronate aminotransferase